LNDSEILEFERRRENDSVIKNELMSSNRSRKKGENYLSIRLEEFERRPIKSDKILKPQK
jgi:hypothetical protein